ncbi:MAG: SRPBCC family protein [Myxococcales bacterium]|nr:SRPBCC family protein [Myxococcales bacterium]
MPKPTGPNPHDPKLPYYETEPFGMDFFRTARERHVAHATCACTPAQLFEIFEDEVSWTKWPIGITGVEWTSPRPLGKGATRIVRMAGGFEIYETFFAWEPGRELAFHITGETQPVWSRFGEHYQVEDLGGGRCRLTWTVAFDPRDTFARIQFLMRPLMAAGFKLYMRRLEKLAARWGK